MDEQRTFASSFMVRRRVNRRHLLCALALASCTAFTACAGPAASPSPPAPTTPRTQPTVAPTPAPKPPPATQTPAPTQRAVPAPTQAPTKPQPIVPLKFGLISGIFDNAYTLIGKDKGIFQKHGIEPEFVGFQDGVLMTKAIIGGELLAGEFGPAPVFTAVEGGAALKVIAATKPKLNFFIASRKEVSSLAELGGKNLGMGNIGSQTHIVWLATLEASKLDAARMNFVAVGPTPQVFQALLIGKVDAAALTTEFSFLVRENPDLKVLVENVGDLLPNYLRFTIVARDQDIRSQRTTLVNLLKGFAEAYRYVPNHRSEVVQVAIEQLANTPAEAARRYDIYLQQRLFDPNLTFTKEQVQYMQELNIKIDRQETVLPFERVATFDLLEQVHKDLGKYTWQ